MSVKAINPLLMVVINTVIEVVTLPVGAILPLSVPLRAQLCVPPGP